MVENKDYIRFVPSIMPDEKMGSGDIWFLFYEGRMLARVVDNNVDIPLYSDVMNYQEFFKEVHYLGRLDGVQCFAAEVTEDFSTGTSYSFMDLRMLFSLVEEEILHVSSKASKIIDWSNSSRYCGRCGALNEWKEGERAKVCPSCGQLNYPRMSPAIIVAIVKDSKILLAHNKNFKGNMYSVVAGFVEVGETFEDCVKREVFEEVGIRVKNIKYYASQPWPFPNSLMIAFTAEYEGGDIKVDNVEIDDAGWFGRDELPNMPRGGSVARKLVDWFIEGEAR